MKLVTGVTPVQLTNVGPVLTSSARTIQLPSSGLNSKSGASLTATNIPVARVIPQQQASSVSGAGFVAFVNQSSGGQQQASPVNLTVTSRPVAPPAMAIPNFSSAKLMTYDGRGEAGGSSVTITTLPAAGQETGQGSGAAAAAQASITPARITPIMPQPSEDSKPVPGSPRPSILRKRPDQSLPDNVKGTALLTSPPPRPESSGSSTISATSSLPGLSGDDQAAPVSASVEPSPRKRARKQQLPPRDNVANVSPEWATGARSRLDWSTRPEADWEGKVCFV